MAATPASPISNNLCLPGSSRVFGYKDPMLRAPIRRVLTISALALPLLAPQVGDVLPSVVAEAQAAQAASWKEYLAARAAFNAQVSAYWTSIADKRRGRNAKRREHLAITLDDYVLTQPPVYTGPKRPVNPEPEEGKPPRERKAIPVVADLLRAAAEHFQFTPQRPATEAEFK